MSTRIQKKVKMQAHQLQFMLWLQALLTDEKRRAFLRQLMQQYELPVIELGEITNS